MGFFDRIDPSGKQDKYIVVARTSKQQPVKLKEKLDEESRVFYDAPMTKDAWEQENFEALEAGVTYYCVETTEEGYTLDDPQWTLEIDDDESTESKKIDRVMDRLEEIEGKVDGPGAEDLGLEHVSDTDEIEAKIQGAVAQRGLGLAESVDDVVNILGAVSRNNKTQGTITDFIGGADNQLKIDSMTDLAMLMMLPNLQQVGSQVPSTLSNVNQTLETIREGGGLFGGAVRSEGQGEDADVVTLDREDYEILIERAKSARDGEIPTDADVGATADRAADDDDVVNEGESPGGDTFSMDEFVDDGQDDATSVEADDEGDEVDADDDLEGDQPGQPEDDVEDGDDQEDVPDGDEVEDEVEVET